MTKSTWLKIHVKFSFYGRFWNHLLVTMAHLIYSPQKYSKLNFTTTFSQVMQRHQENWIFHAICPPKDKTLILRGQSQSKQKAWKYTYFSILWFEFVDLHSWIWSVILSLSLGLIFKCTLITAKINAKLVSETARRMKLSKNLS